MNKIEDSVEEDPVGGRTYRSVAEMTAEFDAEVVREKKEHPIKYYTSRFWLRHIVRHWDSVKWFLFRDIPHRIKWGCSEQDIWSLDYTIAKWMVPRLEAYIAKMHGFPTEPEFMNLGDEAGLAKWKEIVGKMLFAFNYIVLANDECLDLEPWDSEQVKEGLDLFREYFFNLWD